MAVVAAAILAENTHQYREQVERVASFAKRLHIDLTDGVFAKSTTPGIKQIWWPHTNSVDLHIMYQQPESILDEIINLRPSLVILHAEADGNFVNMANKLHKNGIKAGICLLPGTMVTPIKDAIELIDHVLIFSGLLGKFGGTADLGLLKKVDQIRAIHQHVEIGWDGGVNLDNAKTLVDGGINVLNAGGYIQRAEDPKANYVKLMKVSSS